MELALFFDGTGNNLVNSNRDAAKFGNITNIVKLYNSCVLKNKYYVEGIGTKDNAENSQFALATGRNPLGGKGYSYTDKLTKGLGYLEDILAKNPNTKIELFIYGFSRGATIARDFAKKALRNSNVVIKYLGVYDTVVSMIYFNPEIHFDTNEMERISQIVHICAIQECRKFFPLTSFKKNDVKEDTIKIENFYTSKVKEIYVPGAHADVGGGYLSNKETVYLNEYRSSCDSLMKQNAIVKETLKDNFAFEKYKVWDSLLDKNVKCISAGTIGSNLISERNNVMIEVSEVYFETMASNTNSFIGYEIFKFSSVITFLDLIMMRDGLCRYLKTNTPEKGNGFDYSFFSPYTHISANYGSVNQNSVNENLNTFNLTLLTLEIDEIKKLNDNNAELYRLDDVLGFYGINPLYVNQPNNSTWQRKVIYG